MNIMWSMQNAKMVAHIFKYSSFDSKFFYCNLHIWDRFLFGCSLFWSGLSFESLMLFNKLISFYLQKKKNSISCSSLLFPKLGNVIFFTGHITIFLNWCIGVLYSTPHNEIVLSSPKFKLVDFYPLTNIQIVAYMIEH